MKRKILKPLVLVASIALLVEAIALCMANNTPWYALLVFPAAFGIAYAFEEDGK